MLLDQILISYPTPLPEGPRGHESCLRCRQVLTDSKVVATSRHFQGFRECSRGASPELVHRVLA